MNSNLPWGAEGDPRAPYNEPDETEEESEVMTYQEAKKKSLTVKWRVDACSQGEACWCRMIATVEPLLFDDGGEIEEYMVVPAGLLDNETAEHIVNLHNIYIRKL